LDIGMCGERHNGARSSAISTYKYTTSSSSSSSSSSSCFNPPPSAYPSSSSSSSSTLSPLSSCDSSLY
jgi:hypothetical protein